MLAVRGSTGPREPYNRYYVSEHPTRYFQLHSQITVIMQWCGDDKPFSTAYTLSTGAIVSTVPASSPPPPPTTITTITTTTTTTTPGPASEPAHMHERTFHDSMDRVATFIIATL
nr:PREDICTED: uncharacterized protein LOC105662980 [Megachile rotundata]